MMSKTVLIFSLLLALSKCGTQRTVEPPAATLTPRASAIEPEEYAVYSFILRGYVRIAADWQQSRSFVIRKETISNSVKEFPIEWAFSLNEPKTRITPELKAMFEDYRVRNKQQELLELEFWLPYKYFLITQAEWESFFENPEENGWAKFLQKYPSAKGFFLFSRVGFNQDKTRAIVYMETRGSGGGYHLLTKKGDNWIVEDIDLTCWVS